MTSHLHKILTQEIPRDYRTEIPNIVFELLHSGEISVQDFVLYSVLRRIAGQNGACWIGQRGLKERTHLGQDTIIEAKKNLSRPFDLLNGKPLINIETGDYKSGKADTITIIDIWPDNHYHFKEKFTCTQNRPPLYLKPTTPVPETDHKKEPLRNNKEEVYCPAPPRWEKIEKIDCKGKKFSVMVDDLYTECVQRRADWTGEEIEESWKILVNYSAPIGNLMSFVQGTIEKIRLKKTLKSMKEAGDKCSNPKYSRQKKITKEESMHKKEEMKLAEIIKEKTLESGTKMPTLATFALERGWMKN